MGGNGMIDQEQELRKWSAGVMEYKIVCSPDCDRFPLPYCEDKDGNRFSWTPDIPKSGQIWLFVNKMRELGWRLHFCMPGMMYPETNSAGFSLIEHCLMPVRYLKDNNPTLTILLAGQATGVK